MGRWVRSSESRRRLVTAGMDDMPAFIEPALTVLVTSPPAPTHSHTKLSSTGTGCWLGSTVAPCGSLLGTGTTGQPGCRTCAECSIGCRSLAPGSTPRQSGSMGKAPKLQCPLERLRSPTDSQHLAGGIRPDVARRHRSAAEAVARPASGAQRGHRRRRRAGDPVLGGNRRLPRCRAGFRVRTWPGRDHRQAGRRAVSLGPIGSLDQAQMQPAPGVRDWWLLAP